MKSTKLNRIVLMRFVCINNKSDRGTQEFTDRLIEARVGGPAAAPTRLYLLHLHLYVMDFLLQST